MKFPLLSEIASTTVISIGIDSSVSQALELMLSKNHRNIIVLDDSTFRILTIMDVLSIRNKTPDLSVGLFTLDLDEIPTMSKNDNVLDTLEYLGNSVEYICIINPDQTLFGLITHSDISANIDPDTLMDNYRLKDFLKLGRRMKWVKKDEVTSSLLHKMTVGSFDNVIVVEDMKPIGILTTKDVMKLIKNNADLEKTVDSYMTSPVETISKQSSIAEALGFIKSKHYRRVIVVDENNKLIGVIAQKELISLTYSKWALLMKDYQQELTELNDMLELKYKEFETKASTDSLTGLYNRRKLGELYFSSYTSMIQRDNDMSLIILDIDFFKSINDSFGHNTGDQVLIQLSHVLLRNLRNIDIICRWGGEEFVILLPTANLEQATSIAEKLRVSIEEMEIDHVGHMTSSFGVTVVKSGDTIEEVVSRADAALYKAKRSGRNCVMIQED